MRPVAPPFPFFYRYQNHPQAPSALVLDTPAPARQAVPIKALHVRGLATTRGAPLLVPLAPLSFRGDPGGMTLDQVAARVGTNRNPDAPGWGFLADAPAGMTVAILSFADKGWAQVYVYHPIGRSAGGDGFFTRTTNLSAS